MRALLINPVLERDFEYYNLGTVAIASAVNASGRHRAEVVEFSFIWSRWKDYLRERLEAFRPAVVGISTFSPKMPDAIAVARLARSVLPGVKVVMGGHHASLDTEGVTKLDCVDFTVVGEGDHDFVALLDALEDGGGGGRLAAVPSLAWKEAGAVVHNQLGRLPEGKAMDALPFYDWTLIEQHQRAIYHCGYLPMIGVRGCPYRCSFCSSPVLADRLADAGPFVRKRDARLVAQEIAYQWERHARHGLRTIMFYDQNFLMFNTWLRAFSDEYRKLGMHTRLPFSIYSRVDHINEEKLELARAAGCYEVRMGIEAGNPDVRNSLLNKDLNQDELHEKLAMVRRSGIRSLGYFLIGSPGESPEQSDESFRLAREAKIDRAAFFFFTPLWNLPLQGGTSVDHSTRERAANFTSLSDLTTDNGTSLDSKRLMFNFVRANGYFMAKTVARQLRGQGPGFLRRLPGYVRDAARDDMGAKHALAQYVYHHGEAWRH